MGTPLKPGDISSWRPGGPGEGLAAAAGARKIESGGTSKNPTETERRGADNAIKETSGQSVGTKIIAPQFMLGKRFGGERVTMSKPPKPLADEPLPRDNTKTMAEPKPVQVPVQDTEALVHEFNPQEATAAHMKVLDLHSDTQNIPPPGATPEPTLDAPPTPVTVRDLEKDIPLGVSTPGSTTEAVAQVPTKQAPPAASPERSADKDTAAATTVEEMLLKLHERDPKQAEKVLKIVEGKSGPVREKFLARLSAAERQRGKQEEPRATLTDKAFEAVRSIGKWYQKIPFSAKIILGVGMLSGAILSSGALSATFALGLGIRRMLAGTSVFVLTEAAFTKWETRNGGDRTRSQEKRDRWVALVAAALAGGGAGFIAGGGADNLLHSAPDKIAALKEHISGLYGHEAQISSSGVPPESTPAAGGGPNIFNSGPTPNAEFYDALSGKPPVLDIPTGATGAPITFTPGDTGAFNAEAFNAQLAADMKESLAGHTPSFVGATEIHTAAAGEMVHKVTSGENLWNIIKGNLAEQHLSVNLSHDQQVYLDDIIKNKFAGMSSDQLKEIGIKSGNIALIHPDDHINLSKVMGDKAFMDHAIEKARAFHGTLHHASITPHTTEHAVNIPAGEHAIPQDIDPSATAAGWVEDPTQVPGLPHQEVAGSFNITEHPVSTVAEQMAQHEYIISDVPMTEHAHGTFNNLLDSYVYPSPDGHVWASGVNNNEWNLLRNQSAWELMHRQDSLMGNYEFPTIAHDATTERLRWILKAIKEHNGTQPDHNESVEHFFARAINTVGGNIKMAGGRVAFYNT